MPTLTWLDGVPGNLLSAGLAFAAAQLYARWRRRSSLGHLARLAQGRSVQIIIPDFQVADFSIQGTTARARIPLNVRVMPMAEGAAIAELVQSLRAIGVRKVILATQHDYQDTFDLTITVGGPSVNRVSGQVLGRCFPAFHLKYPEHIAAYGSMSLEPKFDAAGALLEDYGFIGVGRTLAGKRCIVLCGIWAPGTYIATVALLRKVPRRSEASNLIKADADFMVISHAELVDLSIGEARIVALHRAKDAS